MAFRIATNVASLNTQRWLSVANTGMSKALERLSSGYKINKAADDAAGIAIATKLNVKAASVSKAIDNGNQAIAMLQTAESGIDGIKNILTRLKEIATQAASDNSSTDRAALDTERTQLEQEINKIAQNTKYGATGLLSGANTISAYGSSLTPAYGISNIDVANAGISATTLFTLTVDDGTGGVTLSITDGTTTQTVNVSKPSNLNTTTANFSELGIKVTINSSVVDISGANGVFTVTVGSSAFTYQLGNEDQAYDQVSISIGNFQADGTILNLSGDITTLANAQTYLTTVDDAITNLNSARASIGASQNQITYHLANLEAMYENTKAAESTIKDADFAAEMANFTKFQIVTQSGISMLAQANQLPQLILSLMR
ncbi:MAG TPA: flagellin [Syntrophorhabdaceae bacterium]|nr:flagellin [Syntrophorhabdaceae bacterium]